MHKRLSYFNRKIIIVLSLLFTIIIIGLYVVSLADYEISPETNWPFNCPEKSASEIPKQKLCGLEIYDGLFTWPVQYSDRESQVTGQAFTGKITRVFKGKREFGNYDMIQRHFASNIVEPSCKRWAVVTTIFKPSEAVRRQVRLEGWCLVVVADKSSTDEYNTGWTKGEGNGAVIYLTPKEQEDMKILFVDALPWNHFGRKNAGYVYAIQHGAEVIWDFDDNNMLKFWMSGAAPPGAPSLDTCIPNHENCVHGLMEVLLPKDHSWPTFNPYPKLGAPTLPSWPRGLPLDDIKIANSFNAPLRPVTIDCSDIGVLQSLADYQPDVDAIYRSTQSIPFWFERSKEARHLIIPTGVMTPYNAQATLHFLSSFFGLFLPVTVNSRVSDIWRGYLAQRLFWDAGIKLGFAARPLVVQDRNRHSYTEDLSGESDLYLRSKELIKFLGQWKGQGRTIVERTEELWVALYEREYIEEADVKLVQQWLQFLIDVGYKFPLVKEEQSTRVLIPSFPLPLNHTSPDLTGEEVLDEAAIKSYCKSIPSLKFVTADRHTGTRIDIPSVLSTVRQSVVVVDGRNGYNWYPNVFKLNGISLYTRVSPGLDQMDGRLDNSLVNQPKDYDIIPEDLIRKNFNFYKDDETISSADGFLCFFPSSMCEMWMPFNKTIIISPAHRYNLWRCTASALDRHNEHLYKLASLNKLVLGASDKYDLEYLHHYTGLRPLPLYNFAGVYTAGNPYSPTRDEIIVFGSGKQNVAEIAKQMSDAVKSFKVVYFRKLYPRYSLSDLVKHRAVVFVPYAVMTYKISELYSLNIPMIVPSIKYYRTVLHGFGPDRVTHGGYYCLKDRELGKPHPTSLHPYSPNVYASVDQEAESYWLQFADFYHWPHVTYFDDYQHLEKVLSKMDFNDIHSKMVVENKRRKLNLQYNLCTVVQRIQKTREGSTFPKDYTKAIKQIYGVDRLQVF